MVRRFLARLLIVIAVLAVVELGTIARRAAAPAPLATPGPDLTAQLRKIDESLDRVEERLLASQASVSRWDDLRDRHESATALTCQNLGAHVAAMATFSENQREKRHARPKNRLASRAVAHETDVR